MDTSYVSTLTLIYLELCDRAFYRELVGKEKVMGANGVCKSATGQGLSLASGKSDMTLEELAVNTIRALSMDAVQKANSGHPGLPMGAADFAYVLWMKILRHDPSRPGWVNRDRFVLSAGHGSVLLYSLLHLFGYGVTLDDLKQFRQWESKTPGHPEYGVTPGVETTTGPLGQGFGNGVGMALAERILAGYFNTGKHRVIDHFTYVLVGDGDIMEGVSSEAASLAGHLGLGGLIYFYDCNQITIEGHTSLAFSEDVGKRFQAYGWHVVEIDGHDRAAIEQTLMECKQRPDQPNLIIGHTHIARGSPHKQDSASAHGEPLGEEEVKLTKQSLGFPGEPAFHVPQEVKSLFEKRRIELVAEAKKWDALFDEWAAANPDKVPAWRRFMNREIPENLTNVIPDFPAGKRIATRNASGEVLQIISKFIENLVGGSADLAPSNKTYLKAYPSIARGEFSGRNLHFGVREHAMGAILNGMALHGGLIAYGGTFLVFSDYMRPSIRMAALMKIPVIYVFTHDSIFVGEDGPTHQPVEHLASLRAIPNLVVIRPMDANETMVAWDVALRRKDGPTALILSRQDLPVVDSVKFSSANGLRRGAYVLAGDPAGKPELILIASGSEVGICMEAREIITARGKTCRVVSMPSWELFDAQAQDYRTMVLPQDAVLKIAVEAGCSLGWHRYVGDKGKIISIDRFGASAPYKVLVDKFAFTAEEIAKTAFEMLNTREPEVAYANSEGKKGTG
jgi:transketolase